jgi:hypothetical protein
MTKEELLAEVEDLIRLTPQDITYNIPENVAWMGRAAALIDAWNPMQSGTFGILETAAHGPARAAEGPKMQLIALIHRMRFELLMKTRGPLNKLVDQGMVFDYFNGLRKVLESARKDLLFVDPYLDAEFVDRYLPQAPRTSVRLLGREKLAMLVPAVKAFSQQSPGVSIEVRSAPNFHDRYVFVDRAECFQSGASFKDGARSAPTTFTQITDAFAAMLQTYEGIWAGGKVIWTGGGGHCSGTPFVS